MGSAERQAFYDYSQGQVVEDPGARALLARHSKVKFSTFTREQEIDDRTWYDSPSVSELRRFGRVDDFLSSTVSWQPGWLHGFIVYRPWGGRRFDSRERRLMRPRPPLVVPTLQRRAGRAHRPRGLRRGSGPAAAGPPDFESASGRLRHEAGCGGARDQRSHRQRLRQDVAPALRRGDAGRTADEVDSPPGSAEAGPAARFAAPGLRTGSSGERRMSLTAGCIFRCFQRLTPV